jgi:hypothetical protein
LTKKLREEKGRPSLSGRPLLLSWGVDGDFGFLLNSGAEKESHTGNLEVKE